MYAHYWRTIPNIDTNLPLRLAGRLFTVLYFSVRSSRSSTLRYGLPSRMSVKTTSGAGAV